MESPLPRSRTHRDHEPTPSPSQEGSRSSWPVPLLGGVRGGLIRARFMESLLPRSHTHWDHEPVRLVGGVTPPCSPSAGKCRNGAQGTDAPYLQVHGKLSSAFAHATGAMKSCAKVGRASRLPASVSARLMLDFSL